MVGVGGVRQDPVNFQQAVAVYNVFKGGWGSVLMISSAIFTILCRGFQSAAPTPNRDAVGQQALSDPFVESN